MATAGIRAKMLGFFVLSCICVLAIALMAVALQVDAAERSASAEAERVAQGLAMMVDAPQMEAAQLHRFVGRVGKLFDRDIVLVDGSGVVREATNASLVGSVYRHANVVLTLNDGQVRTYQDSDLSGPGVARFVVAPLGNLQPSDAGAARRGAVIFEYTAVFDSAMAEARRAAAVTVAGALLLIIVGGLIAFDTANRVVRPLQELQTATGNLTSSAYRTRVPVVGHDEVAQLAGAFNDMAAHLESAQGQLRERNVELAQSVLMLEHGMQQQKDAAQRIEFLAFHDPLTQLPNRAHFSSLLSMTLERAKRAEGRFAILFIDLDRFKQINDTLGHEVGDQLLKEVGHRLKTSLRASDIVARLGGDEFVVILDQLKSDKHAATVAGKVIDAVNRPLVVNDHELRVSASIGISRFVQDGTDEQTLMKNADIAMYQAKSGGRNCYAFYSVERNRNSFERLAMETALRRAIDNDELLLHYQPKLDLQSDSISGMEALLRWQHPDLGMVSPAQFIPIAEETGLIVQIGKWVLRKACQQQVAWKSEGMQDLTVAVNLSPRQFSDDNLLGDVATILAETGMDPRHLELEITESAIMQDLEMGKRLLHALKSMGMRIAVDDFGTGYSSLANVKQFPIDTLKIDRAFVRDLGTDAGDRGITKAIIAMAASLDLRVVAEGVELPEQQAFLRDHGCGEIQGYLFSRPLASDCFLDFVREQQATAIAAKEVRRLMALAGTSSRTRPAPL